jgi:prepilin-type N-terminal cleavage/methylation domain-containing protein
MKKENGFTLVELIIALFIGSLVLTAIYSFLNLSQRSSSGIERKVAAQQDARGALELMALEIQMASYNPRSGANLWFDAGNFDTNCSPFYINPAYRGIREATANSIAIEMDVNGNGTIDASNNEIIRYNYNITKTNGITNKYITRSTDCGGARAFLGDTNVNENRKTVRVVNDINDNGAYNAGTDIPVFRYFNGSGAELTSPVTSQIPDIRRVEITLVVDTSVSDSSSYDVGTRRRIIYSTSVIPRNHFTLTYTN